MVEGRLMVGELIVDSPKGRWAAGWLIVGELMVDRPKGRRAGGGWWLGSSKGLMVAELGRVVDSFGVDG